MRLLTSLAAAALAVPLLAACGTQEGEAQVESAKPPRAEKPTESPEPKVDVLTQASCRHFRNVIGDIDVLTTAELRDKIKEVDEKARYSEDPGIPEASRAMLAAMTVEDGDAMLKAAGEFSDACSAAGV